MNTLAAKLPKLLNPDSINLARANRLLPRAFNVLLIIACSYTLSQITWSLIPGGDLQADIPGNNTNRTKQPVLNYSHISDAHLFGTFQQTEVAPVKTEAPDTRLNLVLKGVLAATPMKLASAIISLGKNGNEDNYSVGDKVSSATVKEIHSDRVILQRAGRLETLRMPDDFSDDIIRKSPTSSRPSTQGGTPGAVLSNIRQEILKNPTSFGKYAIPIPYNENGRLRGYRLQPQGDRSLFDAVGLEPSDIIIAINGVELNDPAKGLKALRSLQRAKQVDITVLRNGAEQPLHFDIP